MKREFQECFYLLVGCPHLDGMSHGISGDLVECLSTLSNMILLEHERYLIYDTMICLDLLDVTGINWFWQGL